MRCSPLRPGLVSVTFRRLSAQEVVRLAARCGLEGIEWGGDVHAPDSLRAREVRLATEDEGLAVAAFGSYWRASGDFGPTLETAVALGAPTIRVWAGAEGSLESSTRSAVTEALREACELAQAHGVTLSLEWHGGTLTDKLESTLRLVREVDHAALRLLWQPTPGRALSERLEEIRAVLPWLSNLHVFQWTCEDDVTQRHPLAEGEAEWREIFDALPESEARFALLEFVPSDDPDLLPREAATLRRWTTSER